MDCSPLILNTIPSSADRPEDDMFCKAQGLQVKNSTACQTSPANGVFVVVSGDADPFFVELLSYCNCPFFKNPGGLISRRAFLQAKLKIHPVFALLTNARSGL